MMPQTYETLYIIRPDLSDEQLEQVILQYQTILQEQGATDVSIQHRGKRRLAYPIKKFREGIYIQIDFKGSGTAISVMERAMRLSEEVIRFLTIAVEVEEVDAA